MAECKGHIAEPAAWHFLGCCRVQAKATVITVENEAARLDHATEGPKMYPTKGHSCSLLFDVNDRQNSRTL